MNLHCLKLIIFIIIRHFYQLKKKNNYKYSLKKFEKKQIYNIKYIYNKIYMIIYIFIKKKQ